MGHRKTSSARAARASLALCAASLLALALSAAPASATPTYPPIPSLSHSAGGEYFCGAAVDSEGDLYVGTFGHVKVYDPSGTQIASFASSSACEVAVDSQGNVYANAYLGKITKYKPDAYPLGASPTYSADTSCNGTGVIDSASSKGVAVDPATDDVYVAHGGHINSYHSDCSAVSTTIGSGVSGAGFSGLAVYGSTGQLYAWDDNAQKLDIFEGATTTPASGFEAPIKGAFGLLSLSVDQANGNVFAFDEEELIANEYTPTGELIAQVTKAYDGSEFGDSEPSALATGGETLYVASLGKISAYGPLFEPAAVLTVEKDGEGTGAVTGGTVSQPNAIECGATCEATIAIGAEVTLSASEDAGSHFAGWEGCEAEPGPGECSFAMAEGSAVTAHFFKPKLTALKAQSGEGKITSEPAGIDCGTTCSAIYDYGATVKLTPEAQGEAVFKEWSGCEAVVEADKCEVTLTEDLSPEAVFAAAPRILGEGFASGETYSNLEGTIDPESEATDYTFQYVTLAHYEAEGFEGAGEASGTTAAAAVPVPVKAKVSGLEPGTEYRFRLLATNPLGSAEGETRPFRTYGTAPSFGSCPNDALRSGPSAKLPDCRAYEQASPVEKHGFDVLGATNAMAAATDGSAVLYYGENGLPNGVGPQSYPTFLARRSGGQWSSAGLLPPLSYGESASLRGWLPDLSTVFSQAHSSYTSEGGLLARDSADGSLTTIKEGNPFPDGSFVGASADDSIVYFAADGGTTPPYAPGAVAHRPNLYAWDRGTGTVALAGVLPDSACAIPPCAPAGGSTVRVGDVKGAESYPIESHAIAVDGDAYFSDAGKGGLYLRKDPFGAHPSTVHVSASRKTDGPGLGGVAGNSPQPATFQGATPDGSTAFFTSSEELTNDATTGPEPPIPPEPPTGIGRANLDGSSPEPEFIPTAAEWLAVSPESVSPRYIYWSNTEAGTIGRAEIGGTNPEPEFIAGLENPQQIAVDSGHIYWAEARDREEGHGTIGRAEIDGSGDLVSASVDREFITGAGDPHGVAVSPESASPRYVYWTNGINTDIGRAEIGGASPDQSFIPRTDYWEPWGLRSTPRTST